MKEHGLLQAIARTNRLYEGKDFGWIIDYRGLLKKLDDAMELYGGAGLENFDSEDIKGVVVDVMASISRVREAHSQMLDLFRESIRRMKKRSSALWKRTKSVRIFTSFCVPSGEVCELLSIRNRLSRQYHAMSWKF